jgi:Holliday junction resolvase RusA-like endonuclease
VWRQALADQARMAGPILTASSSCKFAVHIIFWMNSVSIRRADLDNLAKPVLDTLFRPKNAQVKDLSLTGALFLFDDDRVYRLILEKRQVDVELEQGVDIFVEWD